MRSTNRDCRHPCFNNYDFHDAIIHLPVAEEDNINFNIELNKKNCAGNWNRDDIESVIPPYLAKERFLEAKKSIPNLTVAAISGPGEPLANFELVKETLKLIRQTNPETILCVSTNGLMLPVYANHLISLGVEYITVTINTISPDIGSKLYESITYLGHKYYGVEGANILLQNQISGISYLASIGVSVRVNVEVYPGINDQEISNIVYFAKECGCKMTNIINCSPDKNMDSNGLEAYSNDRLSDLRRECESVILQSYFCKPCHAASVETLNTRLSIDFKNHVESMNQDGMKKELNTFRFAVCSKNGRLIDQHFGHADKFYIYDYTEDVITFVETRPIEQYCHGSKEEKKNGKIYQLIKAIEDCNCVICMKIGACPSEALLEKNIDIYTTYNLINEGISEAVVRLYTDANNQYIP